MIHLYIGFRKWKQNYIVFTHLSKLRDTLYFFTVLSVSSPAFTSVAPDKDIDLELLPATPLLLSCNADNAETFPAPVLAKFDSVELFIWDAIVCVEEEEYPELTSPLRWKPERIKMSKNEISK